MRKCKDYNAHDPRLVYPDVEAPMDHFEAERRNPQIYEEVTTSSNRSFDADTEASFV